jgi:hypothetical protein
MKPIFVLSFFVVALSAVAQPAIDWFTVDGAGGAQTSATYSVQFTAGQIEIGPAVTSSANYTITPGFWSAEDFGPGFVRPQLTIVMAGVNAILSWPSPSSGYVLEETDSIDSLPGSWANTGGSIADNGAIRSVSVPHAALKRFYRLRKN